MIELDEYIKQDIYKPKYLFHGTSNKVDILELRKSIDNRNKDNEDNAIFLTSSFITAAAYAFSRKLKKNNECYSFSINNNGKLPIMTFEVDNLPDDLEAYIYIFKKEANMIKDSHKFTTQYRCYSNLKTKNYIKVTYKDFEKYFERII